MVTTILLLASCHVSKIDRINVSEHKVIVSNIGPTIVADSTISNDKIISYGELLPAAKLNVDNTYIEGRTLVYRNTKALLNVGNDKKFEAVFLVCVDRNGDMTYVQHLKEKCIGQYTSKDINLLIKGLSTYKYNADKNAEEQECGEYKIKLDINALR